MPIGNGGRPWSAYEVLLARTRTIHRPVAPIAYDCVKLIVIRDGSAILLSEFGERPVSPGDVVLLGANVLCGSEPEGYITVTTLYLDTDYVVDQFFWQHAAVLADRLDAEGLAEAVYSEPAQILHLGKDRTGMLMPWLDELVALSVSGLFRERFHRMQALWFSVADVFVPFVHVSPVRLTPSQRVRTRPALPRDRRFAPLREEVRQVADLLQLNPERSWTLREMADTVHLSTSQFGRVFADAYGLSPLGYVAMLRAKRLAELLREGDLPVEEAMRRVGWRSRGHAARLFRQHVGTTPLRYRKRSRGRA
ncbi:helix-turn-helix domain-containing protein [Brachybacterium fresconis]|uniref:helix-turn-helix domain-containing protein n=1 Tax=Brachybacterium fresconis TaxID=173363 RepID=UPI001AE9C610|nr:AraC family transcriptional regulator [Brachybacterium fresconis]